MLCGVAQSSLYVLCSGNVICPFLSAPPRATAAPPQLSGHTVCALSPLCCAPCAVRCCSHFVRWIVCDVQLSLPLLPDTQIDLLFDETAVPRQLTPSLRLHTRHSYPHTAHASSSVCCVVLCCVQPSVGVCAFAPDRVCVRRRALLPAPAQRHALGLARRLAAVCSAALCPLLLLLLCRGRG